MKDKETSGPRCSGPSFLAANLNLVELTKCFPFPSAHPSGNVYPACLTDSQARITVNVQKHSNYV